jgi:hypothetical protein
MVQQRGTGSAFWCVTCNAGDAGSVTRNVGCLLPLHERGACHRADGDPQARDMRRNSALAASRLVAARTDGAGGFYVQPPLDG